MIEYSKRKIIKRYFVFILSYDGNIIFTYLAQNEDQVYRELVRLYHKKLLPWALQSPLDIEENEGIPVTSESIDNFIFGTYGYKLERIRINGIE